MKLPIIVLMCAVCTVACAGKSGSRSSVGASSRADNTARPAVPPAVEYGYKIVSTYPHDPEAYTQGLFWHEGVLWESTGEYGRSTLRQVDLQTGKAVRETALSEDYFGEGSVRVGGSIYYLTWLEETAFVYDAATLTKTGEFSYKGEGWGLTTDGTKLYMSDGTANITVRDPATFRIERTIPVLHDGHGVPYLNELEWIEGRIWANVYTTQTIVIIDPVSGRVEGLIDFTGIESRIDITPSTDVFNGIAHDPATGRTMVTGKNWNKLFEIEIFKK